jgi:broad specificity phosphatase PhoE
MLRIYTIPHLPVENNFRGIVTGYDDQSLPSKSRELVDFIPTDTLPEIDLIITSGLCRAVQTAELLNARLQIGHETWDNFGPIDYGNCHGRKKSDVRKIRRRYLNQPFPNGESYSSMIDRFESGLYELLKAKSSATILLIAHESTEAVLSHLCRQVSLGTELENEDREWRELKALNPTEAEITGRAPKGPFNYVPDSARNTSVDKSDGIA